MAAYGFARPSPTAPPSGHLFVANVGPAVGNSISAVREAFSTYGQVDDVIVPDLDKAQLFVSMSSPAEAVAALEGTNKMPCPALAGRAPVVRHAGLREEEEVRAPESDPSGNQGKPNLLDAEALVDAVGTAMQDKSEDPGPIYDVVFTANDTGVPGLELLPDFVSRGEEEALLEEVAKGDWRRLAKRRVLHYGYEFRYDTRNVDASKPLGPFPPLAADVSARVGACPNVGALPDQLTVNEYRCGVGLAPHVDTHSAFEGAICSVSLAGDTVMEFRRGGERRCLLVPRRSLLVMAGESRYAWQHYIPHRKFDLISGEMRARALRRVSFTLRRVRAGPAPCRCAWPDECDSQQAEAASAVPRGLPPPAAAGQGEGDGDPAVTPEVERVHVQAVYEEIAPHFSSTRFAMWPKVGAYVYSLPRGSVVADCGCGNGKYLGIRRDIAMVATDVSAGLLAQCRERGHDVALGDAVRLPLRGGGCDGAMSIAVLHHLSTAARRVRAIEEMVRVLRPGGTGIITVWATSQEDPRATLNKWLPIPSQDASSSPSSSAREAPAPPPAGRGEGGGGGARGGAGEEGAADGEEGAHPGGDYFVPWHLPFHRAEASDRARRAKGAGSGGEGQQEGAGGGGAPVGEGGGGAGGPGLGIVDNTKKAVIYRRYYHLFVEGELPALVGQVAGAEVVEESWDKSNWVVLFRKKEEDAA